MANWRFILITFILTRGKDFCEIGGKAFKNNTFNRRFEKTMDIAKRLSTDVVPSKYVIAISVDLRKAEFHGSIRIDIDLLKVSDFDASKLYYLSSYTNDWYSFNRCTVRVNVTLFNSTKASKLHRFAFEEFNNLVDEIVHGKMANGGTDKVRVPCRKIRNVGNQDVETDATWAVFFKNELQRGFKGETPWILFEQVHRS